jgi:hypothetical protein
MAEVSPVPFQTGTRKKTPVYFKDEVEGDGTFFSHGLAGEDHCLDVSEHLVRGDIRRELVKLLNDLCMEEPPSAHLETLDAGGCHGFGPEEDAGEGLGVDEGLSLGVEPHDGGLGIGYDCCNRAVEGEPPGK